MDKYMVTVNYGVKELKPPTYWFENGRIQCSVGTSIGYAERPMTLSEAQELSASTGLILNAKAT
jgi:hypothetical protein